MEHRQPVKGVLGFVSSICLLYKALYLEDIISCSLQLLAELGASLANHFLLLFLFPLWEPDIWHVAVWLVFYCLLKVHLFAIRVRRFHATSLGLTYRRLGFERHAIMLLLVFVFIWFPGSVIIPLRVYPHFLASHRAIMSWGNVTRYEGSVAVGRSPSHVTVSGWYPLIVERCLAW